MADWLYLANVKFYDVLLAFKENDAVWSINSKVDVGDNVYIYLALPYKKIGFVTEVMQTNLPDDLIRIRTSLYIKNADHKKPIDKTFMLLGNIKSFLENSDDALSLESLKSNGLKGILMGARKLDNNPELLKYIKDITNEL